MTKLPLIFVMIFSFAHFANAKDGFYISYSLGVAIPKIDNRTANNADINNLKNDLMNSGFTNVRVNSVDLNFPLASQVSIVGGYNVKNFSFDVSYTHIYTKSKEELVAQADQKISYFNFTGRASVYERLQNHLILLHSYYNFNNISKIIKPYVGFGVGSATVHDTRYTKVTYYDFFLNKRESTKKESDRSTRFAYQLIAGSNFDLVKNIQMFADFRYTKLPKHDMTYSSINVGAKFNI